MSGEWPKSGDRKRLDRRSPKSPLGYCACEYEDSVLCVFKADEVIAYAQKFLPVVKMTMAEIEFLASKANVEGADRE